jgi:hypothetical protein
VRYALANAPYSYPTIMLDVLQESVLAFPVR